MAKKWDVFISHASADKDAIARPLARSLARSGFDVWFDEFELRPGDSLREKIDHGLANSRVGVVVLSPAFFGQKWASMELGALVALSAASQGRLIPVWHRVDREYVVVRSPLLADLVAIRSEGNPEPRSWRRRGGAVAQRTSTSTGHSELSEPDREER